MTKSAVHPAGPVTRLPLPQPASFATVYAHLSCVVVAENFWGPRTTHNYNYRQGLQGLVCLVSPPSANSIIANRMQMSWTAKLNSKQAGGRKEREKEDSTANQTEKRVSNFQIAYRLRFLLFNLRWNCLFFATQANDIKSLPHTLYPYLCPSLLLPLPLWHYSFHVALFCLACKFNLRF